MTDAIAWLNRLRILLNFLSFWLVAPEFVGEARLKSWEAVVAKGLNKLPTITKVAYFLTTISMIVAYVIATVRRMRAGTADLPGIPQNWTTILALSSGLTIAAPFIAERLVPILANDKQVRQRFLFLGAGLFVVATLIEFGLTFLPSPVS